MTDFLLHRLHQLQKALPAVLTCSVMRLMTRVTGRPLDTAGWKVSNLMYLRECNNSQDSCQSNGSMTDSYPLQKSVDSGARTRPSCSKQALQAMHALPGCFCSTCLSPAAWACLSPATSMPAVAVPRPHQSPVSPSHSPLIRSPVMQPSRSTASATAGSIASRAARALL